MTTPTEKEQEIWSFVFQTEWQNGNDAIFNGRSPEKFDPLQSAITAANRAADAYRSRFGGGMSDHERRVEEMVGECQFPSASACRCRACNPHPRLRICVCDKCGSPGCQGASNHTNACTNSNEPGKEGSVF